MKDKFVNIGLINKGRMAPFVKAIFRKKKIKILSKRGGRDLFGKIQGYPNLRIMKMSAKEILNNLAAGVLDFGWSGADIFFESEPNIQSKISIFKKYDWGKSSLIVAAPNHWVDLANVTDLEEISWIFFNKKKRLMRVATKFPNLTSSWLNSRGITQYELIASESSTETCPFNGKSDIISELVSSGETLRQNNLKIIISSVILKSSGSLICNKKSLKKKEVRKAIKLIT